MSNKSTHTKAVAPDPWDGKERRLSGVGDRRNPARVSTPFQEFPKMVDGRTVNSADEEAAHVEAKAVAEKEAAKAAADAAKKDK